MYASQGLLRVTTVAQYEAAVVGLTVEEMMRRKAYYEAHPPPCFEPIFRERGHGRSEMHKLGCKPKSPRPQPKRKQPTATEEWEITRGWQQRLQERKFTEQREAIARVATYNRIRKERVQEKEEDKPAPRHIPPATIATNTTPRPEHAHTRSDIQKTARYLQQTKRRLGRASLALTAGTPGNHGWVSDAKADREFRRADEAALKLSKKADNPFYN